MKIYVKLIFCIVLVTSMYACRGVNVFKKDPVKHNNGHFSIVKAFRDTTIQEGHSKIHGQVFSTYNNQPTDLADIEVYNVDLKTLCYLDSLGKFNVTLPVGTYKVLLRASGYNDLDLGEVNLRNRESVEYKIYLDLHITY